MSLELSTTAHKRLTLVNTLLLVFFAVVGLSLFLSNFELALPALFQKVETDIMSSRVLEKAQKLVSTPALEIPRYQLKIKSEKYRELEVLIQKLQSKYVLDAKDKRWFPGTFYANNEPYKMKLRLRGDLSSHWKQAVKSWRVKFKKKKYFNKYRELNFVNPKDKGYYVDHVLYELARIGGVLVPDSGYAHLTLNGVPLGLHFWFEQFGAEMLERQQYPEGEIFAEDNTWLENQVIPFGFPAVKPFNPRERFQMPIDFKIPLFPGNFRKTIQKGPAGGFYANRWNQFLQLIESASDEEFEREIPQFLNLEKYFRWNVLTWLVGSMHAHWGDNLRWYYDNTTGLFEPIFYDPSRYPIADAQDGTFEGLEYDPLAKRVFRIPEYQQKRNEFLWIILNDPKIALLKRIDYYYKNLRPMLLRGLSADLVGHYDDYYIETKNIIGGNLRTLKGHLKFARVFTAPSLDFDEDGFAVLRLRIIPDSLSFIAIPRIELALDEKIAAFPNDVTASLQAPDQSKQETKSAQLEKIDGGIRVNLPGLKVFSPRDSFLVPQPREWILKLRFPNIDVKTWSSPGYVKAVTTSYINSITKRPIQEKFNNQAPLAYGFQKGEISRKEVSIDQFIVSTDLPFRRENKSLILEAGEYDLTKTISVPRDYQLHLKAGVILRLSKGVSVISFRPLTVSGTESSPVQLLPKNEGEPWGSFAVVQAAGLSRINYLQVKGGSEAHVNGIFLSGQLCFYSSDVVLENCLIENAYADDGLNVKKSKVVVKNCRFEKNSGDGFDGDWISGSVTGSFFLSNRGDGFDLSGSDILSAGNKFFGMSDKALSIGENTRFTSAGDLITHSGIGLAVKDSSEVEMLSGILYHNKTAMSLYRKKQIFSGGSAKVTGALFWDNEANLAIDSASSMQVQSIGADTWEEREGVSSNDVRLGPIAKYYRKQGGPFSFSFVGEGADAFKEAPKTGAREIHGIRIPDLSTSPVGLLKLDLATNR